MGTSLENSEHIVPEDVGECVRILREDDVATQARHDEILEASRPTEDERKHLRESRLELAHGGNQVMAKTNLEIEANQAGRIRDLLKQMIDAKKPYRLADLINNPPAPPPTDHSFWWASTTVTGAAKGNMVFDAKGLYLSGYTTSYDGDLHYDSFGVEALFGLARERVPTSATGRWRSSPHVELFGGVMGYAGNEDLLSGDKWAKCWMHLDQQVFQVGFGAEGPTPIILGQAHAFEQVIDDEDNGHSTTIAMPGFQLMPPVIFGNINPTATVWARLQVRFDTQTEGEGSSVWIAPLILFRTFQWPLTAL